MKIRIVKPDEGKAVFRHLFDNGMHEENALSFAPLSFVKAKEYVERLCESNGKTGIVIVAETEGGAIAGSLGAEIQPASWFSDAWVLYEKWLYVDPKHRRGPAALGLLRALDAYGKNTGIPVSCGVQVKEGVDRKADLFGRYFKKTGCYFTGGSDQPFVWKD